MAKVLLTCTALAQRDNNRVDLNFIKRMQGAYHQVVKSASLDQHRVHQLVTVPEDAEIILFVELEWGGGFSPSASVGIRGFDAIVKNVS